MRRAPLLLGWLTLFSIDGLAQDWPHWRGPSYDGSTTVTGLPVEFGPEKGVRWKLELPGPGAATPIVVGERVYVTAIDEAGQQLVALCVDRESGEPLWDRPASSGYRPQGASSGTVLHPRSNYASPSPVADGERVVFFFGNGDLVAYDLEGEELWRRNLQADYGDFSFQWTFSASPTLWEGRLYLQILQRDEPVGERGKEGNPSFLLALDPEDGKTIWRHERPSDAQKESLESYATPIPWVSPAGRKELLVVGGDVITGHDPADGAELWRWGTWNEGHREIWWRLVPSAVVGAGKALVCAPKGAPVYAVPLGKTGTLAQDAFAWRSEGRRNPVTSDVPTPLFYRGKFYVLSDLRNALSCLDPESGEVAWTTELPHEHLWRASPAGADGRIWFMNHGGLVLVADAVSGAIVHRAQLGEQDEERARSSIAIAHGCLFVRTSSSLWCFEK